MVFPFPTKFFLPRSNASLGPGGRFSSPLLSRASPSFWNWIQYRRNSGFLRRTPVFGRAFSGGATSGCGRFFGCLTTSSFGGCGCFGSFRPAGCYGATDVCHRSVALNLRLQLEMPFWKDVGAGVFRTALGLRKWGTGKRVFNRARRDAAWRRVPPFSFEPGRTLVGRRNVGIQPTNSSPVKPLSVSSTVCASA